MMSVNVRNEYQQLESYSGFHFQNELSYQGLIAPDGLFVHVHGPEWGCHNDGGVLNASGVLVLLCCQFFMLFIIGLREFLKTYFPGCVIYGDSFYQPAHYPVISTRYMEDCPRKVMMNNMRTSVEWGFGELLKYWHILSKIAALQLNRSDIRTIIDVCFALHNFKTCRKPSSNATSLRFGLAPPTVEDIIPNFFDGIV